MDMALHKCTDSIMSFTLSGFVYALMRANSGQTNIIYKADGPWLN